MNTKQVLALILEDEPKAKPALHIVPSKPKPSEVQKYQKFTSDWTAHVPFNEQRKQIRALIETAWLKPYHQAYLEIDARMEKPERLPYEAWLKSLNSISSLVFWSACIRDNLGMNSEEMTSLYTTWSFAWGKAKFRIQCDLASVFKFWKALNKRI